MSPPSSASLEALDPCDPEADRVREAPSAATSTADQQRPGSLGATQAAGFLSAATPVASVPTPTGAALVSRATKRAGFLSAAANVATVPTLVGAALVSRATKSAGFLSAAAIVASVLTLAGAALHFGSPGGEGPIGLLLFSAAFVAATVLMLPSTPGTIAAGWLYGLLPGVALVIAVSFIADSLTFLIARKIGRERIERLLTKYPRLRKFDQTLADEGFWMVTLLRLSPLAPYNVLNYALGVTRVSLPNYLLGSALGSLPGTILFVAIGLVLRHSGAAVEGRVPAGWEALELTVTVVLSLIATLGLARVAKRQMAIKEEGPPVTHSSAPASMGDQGAGPSVTLSSAHASIGDQGPGPSVTLSSVHPPIGHPGTGSSTTLPSAYPPIPRVSGSAPRALVSEHLRAGRPVVFERLIDDWAALREWTPDGLAKRIGDRPVELFDFTRRDALSATFGEFAAWMQGRRSDGPLAAHEKDLYLAWNASVLAGEPELRAQFDFGALFPRGLGVVHTGFWMGPTGAHTPLHYDLDAPNLHATIFGKKRFLLFEPEQDAALYPADLYEWTTCFSQVDVRAPDLDRHPLFARARGFETVLGPGDILFIPIRWWHAAWCVEPAISLNGWWFGPSLLASLPLWKEAGKAALHRLGLYARERCTCCGHGDLRRHLGWKDAPSLDAREPG